MFISVLELFKVGIGPSSSHTLGPMVAANHFLKEMAALPLPKGKTEGSRLRITFKGSLGFTGRGHGSDRGVTLGLHGYRPSELADQDVTELQNILAAKGHIDLDGKTIAFDPIKDVVFDTGDPLPEHSNGMIFEWLDAGSQDLLKKIYFSIGGGFINTLDEIKQLKAPIKVDLITDCPYPFDSASGMLKLAIDNHISIAQLKYANELDHMPEASLLSGMDIIWSSMQACLERGLRTDGVLPGGLNIKRRAKSLYEDILKAPAKANLNDWLCAYAIAVNEENAAGNMVVTAPTNGAAGVVPAVLYYLVKHEDGSLQQVYDFLLTAAAIGGIIKLRSSISGAEVGCQGEVGSAAAMAAAGLCAAKGGTPKQVENAAEIALEHHLGMTCDPVNGLVQVPCIERNGFGAIKAYTAASLALKGSGEHFMPLDNCIEAMRQTGQEMSVKYKETSLGGLAVSYTEC
jgi:L-serine dehydratase